MVFGSISNLRTIIRVRPPFSDDLLIPGSHVTRTLWRIKLTVSSLDLPTQTHVESSTEGVNGRPLGELDALALDTVEE